MSGHGWVRPLPSVANARCGRPGICSACQREQAENNAETMADTLTLTSLCNRLDRKSEWIAELTKQRDQLRAALQRLVDAKDEKDANGDTPRYRELKAGAWEEAREVLLRAPRSE